MNQLMSQLTLLRSLSDSHMVDVLESGYGISIQNGVEEYSRKSETDEMRLRPLRESMTDE